MDDVLEEVELTGAARRRVGGYSLGMRQRLSVAGALLGLPELLVLDEPANGLDPEGIRWLRDFLRSFAAGGGTVFISSHVLAEVAQLADEVVIIHRGRLVAQEPLETLTARAAGGTVVRSPEAERLRATLARRGRPRGDRSLGRRAAGRGSAGAGGRDRRSSRHRPARASHRGSDPRGSLPRADRRKSRVTAASARSW